MTNYAIEYYVNVKLVSIVYKSGDVDLYRMFTQSHIRRNDNRFHSSDWRLML